MNQRETTFSLSTFTFSLIRYCTVWNPHQPIITDTKPAAARTRQPRRIGSCPFADLIGRLQSEEASLPALHRSGFSRDDSSVRVPDGCKLAQRRPGGQETADGVITRQGKGSGTKTFYICRKQISAHGKGCPGIVSTVRCTVPWVEILARHRPHV